MSLDKLYQSILERWQPEEVVTAILELNLLIDDETNALRHLTREAGYSSMSRRFAEADDLSRQIQKASELFPGVPTPENLSSPRSIEEYIGRLKNFIAVTNGLDFLRGRHNRKSRTTANVPYKGHRAYNKRFRLLGRMEDKLARYQSALTMRNLARVAKSRLAFRIKQEDFYADPNTAIYIAYVVARLNRRSVFTWGTQDRAFDRIANMFFKRLDPKRARWYAIALVDPDPIILQYLTEVEKGLLIGEWFKVMRTAAKILKELIECNNYDLTTMVVQRGNDSSSWNEVAGAFNKCRQGWISTILTAGMGSVFEQFLPGKALRLMAADVAYMHQEYGSGDLHPDTKVWNILPKPWEVILGEERNTRQMITDACLACGVDPNSWTESLKRQPVDTLPTPELVHGVVIESPELAKKLRKLGYFSGPSKGLRGDPKVKIKRDYSGTTLKVSAIEDNEECKELFPDEFL